MAVLSIPEEIFTAYEDLGSPMAIDVIDMGLINKTYLVTTATMKFVLQEVSPIFETTINEDSDAVCEHLLRCGIEVPKLYRTAHNERFVSFSGRIFRALKYIAGNSSHTITSLNMAESAGRVVGQFHAALADFYYDYRSKRRHGGDYRFHKENLVTALKEHRSHDYFARVSILADKMLEDIERITSGLSTTARNVHGDPKISNIIFDERGEAICLVDFDTLGKSGWSLEIADALRSWCNPNMEDVLDAYVDLNIAESALKGYGAMMRGRFTKKEADELVTHSQAITLCLAMRYLADVLNERYWAFDQKRFLRRADHNLLRSQAMYGLFSDFCHKSKIIEQMVGGFLL